jgi:L-fucose isomerase-like protein
LAHPLHVDLYEPSGRDVGPTITNSEYANSEQPPCVAAGDIQTAGDMSVAGSLSQQTSKPNIADEQIDRRSSHLNTDGLVISIMVQSSHATFYSQLSIPAQKKWPDRMGTDDDIEMDVRKAISAKRLRRRDGSYSMELYCAEGPSSVKRHGDYQMQWL